MSETRTDRLLAERYALGEVLGRGGMGTVWRAHDTLLGRPVRLRRHLPRQRRHPLPGAGRARPLRPGLVRSRLLVPDEAAFTQFQPGTSTLRIGRDVHCLLTAADGSQLTGSRRAPS